MSVICKSCGEEMENGSKKCNHCGEDQRIFFRKHKIASGFFAFIFLLIIWLATSGGSDVSNGQDPNVAAPFANPPELTESGAIKVSAAQLAAAYKTNVAQADKTYKGKAAEITGFIKVINATADRPYITLSASNQYEMTNIQCFFRDSAEVSKLTQLQRGDTITVQGIITGKSLNVQVNSCALE